MARALSPKQRAFVEHYAACGNATGAARKAGYKYPNVAGAENLVKHSIQAALSALTEKTSNERIADAKERQEFWTAIMRAEHELTRDRLKASEHLGKAQQDFIERKEHTGKDGAPLQAPDLQVIFVDALPVVD